MSRRLYGTALRGLASGQARWELRFRGQSALAFLLGLSLFAAEAPSDFDEDPFAELLSLEEPLSDGGLSAAAAFLYDSLR